MISSGGIGRQIGEYLPGSHERCLVNMSQFLAQALVEGEQSGLGAGIVHVTCLGGEGSLASQVHNVAMVSLHHAGQELLSEEDGCDQVHIEDFPSLGLGLVQQGHCISNARIVDEDGRVPVFRADAVCNGDNDGRIRDVGLIEECVGCCRCGPRLATKSTLA